jgi:uncharacterized membrane protein
MKMVPKLKISKVAPRKISVLLCQALAVTVVSFNVCNGLVAKFAVRQKCA